MKKLTLIELLISMAIFTILITILMKAFGATSEISSRTDAKLSSSDKSRFVLNLLSDDIQQAIVEQKTNYEYNSATQNTTLNDKSLYLYFDDNKQDLRFYIPGEDHNSIRVIQYLINDSDKTLKRHETTLSREYANNDFSSYFGQNPPDESSNEGDTLIPSVNFVSAAISINATPATLNDSPYLYQAIDSVEISLELKPKKGSSYENRLYSRKIFIENN